MKRRHAELEAAIGRRRWFDPWVFEVDDAADEDPIRAAVFPWVAGVATAFELFPGTMQLSPEATVEPLALLYQHVDADDLEDADELLAEIDLARAARRPDRGRGAAGAGDPAARRCCGRRRALASRR